MKKIYTVLLLIVIVLSVVLFYINLTSPIKIALISNFEDERYSFSTSSIIAGRIAESDINKSNGIRGKKTELVVRDDDFKKPEDTVKFLKDNKIEVIITTEASKDLLQLKPYLEQNKIACISVGATSTSLSGQNDYIYRMLPDDEKEVKAFFDWLAASNMDKNIVLIYDKSNLEYKNSIESSITKLGGRIVFQESWGEDSVNYIPSNPQVMKDNPILILGAPRHTALVVQKLREFGVKSRIFGTSWSGDSYLLSYGGRPVDGFTLTTPVDFSSSDKKALELANKLKVYKKGTGLIPNGVYEAYKIIKKAYEDKYEQHITLKEALDKSDYFDKYGDSKDKELIFTVKNGEFVKVGGSSSESTEN